MIYKYEFIMGDSTLPIKAIIHSVDGFDFHWHDKIEIILVLAGSANVSVGKEVYLLQESDLILINSNEIHSTRRTKDENILLALQIDPEFYRSCYPMFLKMIFNCKSFLKGDDNEEKFNTIRYYIANIVWTLNKKNKGYELIIGSYVYLIGSYLINNFHYEIIESKSQENNDKDLIRINNILNYVNENFHKNITLREISEKEHLNYHFLSHFIKDKIGMSFQDYLNIVRLNNAVNLLMNSDDTITNIASISGFPSINSFNRLFKKEYNCSPSEYREVLVSSNHETFKGRKESKKIGTYLDVNRNDALKKLYKYLLLPTIKDEDLDTSICGNDIKLISIDGNNEGETFTHYWKKIITFGRASEGLRNNFQLQLRELQGEIGFDYIRFHGIFMDEMMIYNISNQGKVEYNWSYVDNLFDFFKEVNIKPFIELSFMPSELKSTEDTVFFWKGNISPPKDINLWTELVKELIKHCINRYGLKEVETWYFEVWNEPEYEYFFWAGSKEEYFTFYKYTTFAIKSISENLKVGGPAITHGTILTSSYLQDFLSYCNDNDILLDFISLHIYPEYISLDDVDKSLLNDMDSRAKLEMAPKLKKIYTDKNNTLNTLKIVNNKILEELNYKPEINVTEWNASSFHGNFIHDTSYVAAFIIKNILQCIGATSSLGYWTFTDLMEENKLGISSFHGGFGLLNKEGLKKPSYYAYYLLSKLGDKIIDQGEDYIITKKDESIQILAYNYVYFDELFLHGDVSALTHKERYLIYEEKPVKEIEFSIKNITGYYNITKYKLNRESGSVFDKWIELGAPENMTKEELKYLQGKAQPKIEISELKLQGEYKDRINVPAHGVELIILEKRV
ncbi:helix-turn-helix domain-containing protein [Clostridium algidicarnis]|uniref:GH39 family glycosyl hydrolase n=1 Tax=Clostridium algidicarnis TaxID=37659 RepID=UPI001CF22FAD|nr:helix-turn-helix domain-containing protein [Clostridium algidicarnis]MCB2286461.1 helix-turn-helix domain-containing protein [Clostridium algidicarnis]